MEASEAKSLVDKALKALEWKAPYFMISSVTRSGTDELVQQVGRELEEIKALEAEQQGAWTP